MDVRTLIISDIHANLTALEAVLKDAGEFDQAWCLGDIVGYGPDPNECIERIRGLKNLTCIMGNHDAALLGFISMEAFNPEARDALLVQAQMLSPESMEFLELVTVRTMVDGITLAHGSPRNPIWEYIMNASMARENFSEFETQVCLVGHTHIPCIFIEQPRKAARLLMPESGDMWRSPERFILNPGSAIPKRRM